jgi:hypothetical protein
MVSMCVRDGKSHEAGGEGYQWCPVEKNERKQRGDCGDRKAVAATPQYEGMIGIGRGEDAEHGFPRARRDAIGVRHDIRSVFFRHACSSPTMPRLPRQAVPGQPQDIIQRGNNRQVIFAAVADYQFFRDAMVEAAIKHRLAAAGWK